MAETKAPPETKNPGTPPPTPPKEPPKAPEVGDVKPPTPTANPPEKKPPAPSGKGPDLKVVGGGKSTPPQSPPKKEQAANPPKSETPDKGKKPKKAPPPKKDPKQGEKAPGEKETASAKHERMMAEHDAQSAPPPPPQPTEAPRTSEKEEIVHLNLGEIHPFKDHPFSVRDDAEMRAMVSSVKDKGVSQPAIVRPREGGGYEMVSGHRRQMASRAAGFTNMPCIVRKLTDEQAITQMVEDNTNQREKILPSERAKALKMQQEAIKRQGARDGDGRRSEDIVGERNKMTGKQVQRYIKLNDLVPDLMQMVDAEKIKFTVALELAGISRKNQGHIAVAIEACQSTPSLSQAQRMRDMDKDKVLNSDAVDGIMTETKKEEIRVIISSQELSKYFGPDQTPKQMKEKIMEVLDAHLPKQEKTEQNKGDAR